MTRSSTSPNKLTKAADCMRAVLSVYNVYYDGDYNDDDDDEDDDDDDDPLPSPCLRLAFLLHSSAPRN